MSHDTEHERAVTAESAPRRKPKEPQTQPHSALNQTLGVPPKTADGPVTAPGTAAETARQGLSGASTGFPHLEILQQAFGGVDLSSTRSAVGGGAARAGAQLGAEGFATPEGVGFREAPSLHTAAHEAAHVVQQRMGYAPSGGLGRGGADPLEQHADRVADAVVGGQSVGSMFSELGTGGGTSGQVVQLKTAKEQAVELETRDGGHSLDRHGPDVSDKALQDRLKTGVAPDGAFVPAPGLSTKFASHEDYMTTRQAAVGKMDAGAAQASAALRPLAAAIITAKQDFEAEPAGPNKGKLSKDVNAKKKALVDGAKALSGSWTLKVKAEPMAATADDMVVTHGRYRCVVDHGKKIGTGFAGSDEKEVTSPDGSKTGKGFDTVTPVPSLTKTRTKFDLGGAKKLSGLGSAAAFNAAQHFPCDETVGISL